MEDIMQFLPFKDEEYLEEEEDENMKFEIEQQQRYEELIQFIDDFINSEETIQYTFNKKNIIKVDKAVQHFNENQTTQTCAEDLIIKKKDVKKNLTSGHDYEKYPLTGNSLKAYLKEKYEKLRHKPCKEIIKHQDVTINRIREQIRNDGLKYRCHNKIRREIAVENKKKLLFEICNEFNLDVNRLTLQSKEKVICLKSNMINKREQRKIREKNILEKILKEYERQRQIDAELNKTYDYKVKKKERIVRGMFVQGTQMKLLPPEEEQIAEEIIEDLSKDVIVETEVVEEKKGKKKDKKDKKTKKDKKDKKSKSKKTKDKSSKKSKKDKKKKSKKEIEEDILRIPIAPIVNKRLVIKADEFQKAEDLIRDMEELSTLNIDNKNYEKDLQFFGTITLPIDKSFTWKPKLLLFMNYKINNIYRKRVCIKNIGTTLKKCRYYRTSICEECDDPRLLQVEAFGTIKEPTGLNYCFTIIFSPRNSMKLTEGEITFLTYNKDVNSCGYFTIPLKCVPYTSKIQMKSNLIKFEITPFWRTKNRYKYLQIKNPGYKTLIMTIRPINDPYQIEDYWLTLYETNIEDVQNNEEDVNEDEENEALLFLENLVLGVIDECIGNVFSNYKFESYFQELKPTTEITSKVCLKPLSDVGYYLEKFQLNIYEVCEDEIVYIGGQELSITAETSGHFIFIEPNVVNLGVCSINTVHNIQFEVYNSDKIMHRIAVKFPSKFSKYLLCNTSELYIQAHETQKVCFKFIPREDIFFNDFSNYDKDTSNLQFSIHLCILSRNYTDTPTRKLTVLSTLTDPKIISITTSNEEIAAHCHDEKLLNFGLCNNTESVNAYIKLVNHSFQIQEYGFLDLPDYITIEPNYGFGTIQPTETKVLRMIFSPNTDDLPASKLNEKMYQLNAKIGITTIKHLGGIQEGLIKTERKKNTKDINRKVNFSTIDDDVCPCIDKMQCFFTNIPEEYEYEYQDEIQFLYNTDNFEEGTNETNNTDLTEYRQFSTYPNNIYVTGTLINPSCDFSHQFIKFPDTPCGSYSTVTIELKFDTNKPISCDCEYLKNIYNCKKQHVETSANFHIYGNNQQFSIEPSCGQLNTTDKISLILVVRPEIPDYIIQERAEDIKREEIINKKREEWKLKKLKELAAKLAKANKKKEKPNKKEKNKKEKKGKEKKGKEKKGKGKEKETKSEPLPPKPEVTELVITEPEPIYEVLPDEIILSYLDFYPAEMSLWRSWAGYCIKGTFTCAVSYESDENDQVEEKINLNAMCNVITPDFIHNLDLQHINFGPVVVGDTSKKIISIQNIQYDNIKPFVFPLSPIGPFTCPMTISNALESELILKLPLTFRPLECSTFIEYFEITAGKTICPIIVSGEGVEANITINPDFLVCRLEGSIDGISNCNIEINNKSSASISINLFKVCEIEGKIIPKEVPGEKVEKTNPKDKKTKGKDKKKKEKKAKEKPKKINKFSKDLTPDEIYSLQNFFIVKKGESHFDMSSSSLHIEANSKKNVLIRFGLPAVRKEADEKAKEKGKKNKADKKAKKEKGSKKDKKSSKKSSKKSKKSEKSVEPEKYYYISKFNVTLGQTTFLKDFIIIATFV